MGIRPQMSIVLLTRFPFGMLVIDCTVIAHACLFLLTGKLTGQFVSSFVPGLKNTALYVHATSLCDLMF